MGMRWILSCNTEVFELCIAGDRIVCILALEKSQELIWVQVSEYERAFGTEIRFEDLFSGCFTELIERYAEDSKEP